MSSNEQVSSQSTRGLLDISGIGPAHARALAAIGVSSVADLSERKAGELAEALADSGHPMSAKTIEGHDWIGQARRLVADRAPSGNEPAPRPSVSVPPRGPTGDHPVQHAAFSIFFDRDEELGTWQTRIYREEGEGREIVLDGIDPAQWVRFIFRDAALPSGLMRDEGALRRAAEEASPVAAATDSSDDSAAPAAEILEIAVTESRSATRPSEPWLSVDVEFEVTGVITGGEDATDLAYLAETLIVDRESGELRTIVSHHDRLRPGVIAYSAHTELPMPPVGRYSIETVVLLFPPLEVVTCRRGPSVTITA